MWTEAELCPEDPEAEAAAACVLSGSDGALLLGGRVETELQRNQRRKPRYIYIFT